MGMQVSSDLQAAIQQTKILALSKFSMRTTVTAEQDKVLTEDAWVAKHYFTPKIKLPLH